MILSTENSLIESHCISPRVLEISIGKRYKCIVCGRVFPEGQGIVIKTRDLVLAFHKKSCFVKFFKYYIEISDPQCFDKYAKKIIEEFEKLHKTDTAKKRFLEEDKE